MKRLLVLSGALVIAFAASGSASPVEAAQMCADYGQTCNPDLGPGACCNPELICGTETEPGVFRCEAID
jgi:hypothetical protein